MFSIEPPPGQPEVEWGISALPETEVLYEAEEPIIYVSQITSNLRLLIYLAEASGSCDWLVAAPIGGERLLSLKAGFLPVRAALFESWTLLCRRSREGSLQFWSIEEDDLPPHCLPLAGTPLYSEHVPVLVAKAIGPELTPGRLTSSVISSVADSGRKALKTLLDYVMDQAADGKPTNAYRAMYDLPVRRLGFGSFEVAFGAPQCDETMRTITIQAAEKLRLGLHWLTGLASDQPPGNTDEEKLALLESLVELTPTQGGQVEQMMISGSWVGPYPIALDKRSRLKVRSQINALRAERVISQNGRVREMDQDRLSFTLRDLKQGGSMRVLFSEEMLDDVLRYFNEGLLVNIVVVSRLSRYLLRAITQASDAESSGDPLCE